MTADDQPTFDVPTGQPLFFIGEDAVGSTDDLPDPSKASSDEIIESCQSDPVHGWRFSKNSSGTLTVDLRPGSSKASLSIITPDDREGRDALVKLGLLNEDWTPAGKVEAIEVTVPLLGKD